MGTTGDSTNTQGERGQPPRSLRQLRETVGLNQTQVVQKVKQALPNVRFSQPALSRAEKGRGRLTPDIVRVLCRLYGVTGTDRAALIQQAEDAEADYVDARVVLQAGNTVNLQQRFARLEREAVEVRSYNPVMVIGSLQTAAYAAAVFGTSEDDPHVRGRMARQREMLAEPRRRWTFVQTEGSLRWQARSAKLMAEQVEHLVELSRAPNVDLRVIDWRTPVEVFQNTAFHLYDDTAVVVGTRDGTAIMTDRARLADYRSLFDELVNLAAAGEASRDVLRRIANDYRSLLNGTNSTLY
ncbi:MAG: helix-turn-helix domain-containing protein [Pseudonocardiales bacterium]|nr:helix-turn-helix domain-containing protein [Pseudonocardiales bacterium]